MTTASSHVQTTAKAGSPSPQIEYVFKILVVGDPNVGKTSLIQHYVHSVSAGPYKPTIGVDFAMKVLQYDANTVVRLQLWDIAGQERFGSMTRVYYKEAVAALVVFDITKHPTFEAVQKWKADIDSKVFLPGEETPIPSLLVANKCDLAPLHMIKSQEEMNHFCTENGFVGHFETSAKTNKNVEESFKFLVDRIMDIPNLRKDFKTTADTVNLLDGGDSTSSKSATKKSGCC